MNPVTAFSSRINVRLRDRGERWRRRSDAVSALLSGWRTPHRTRLLVRTYLGSLALGTVISVIQVFWPPVMFAWLLFTVISLASWTMLRTVINIRDVAPEDELDEYELEVLRTWQVTAYGWLVILAMVASTFMIILGASDIGSLDRWMYTGGLFTLLGVLAAVAMPTIAYATTFGPVPPDRTTDPTSEPSTEPPTDSAAPQLPDNDQRST